MKTIAIIGFGKIGQAIAANALQHGFNVLAIDTNAGIAREFEQSAFRTGEPGVQDLLVDAFNTKRLVLKPALDQRPDAVIISIPLTVGDNNKTVDAPFLRCLEQLAPYCKDDLLIIVETSVPVGYCRQTLLPVLESAGKKHGIDFLLAHSPERIKSGTMLSQLDHVPKVVGGITPQATAACTGLYRSLLKKELIHPVQSIEAAELLKLAGMIYRDVNIALSNQLAVYAQQVGIDFASLIPLINTDNEARLLLPGIGVGGHCTPVYPHFLMENFRSSGLEFSLAASARQINTGMPEYAISLIRDKVKTKRALVLGLSFRPGVREDANSVGAALYRALGENGFEVCLHDEEFDEAAVQEKGFVFADPMTAKVEAVFLVTMHPGYRQLDFNVMAGNGVRFIVDGRNLLDRKKVMDAGISYTGIGH